MANFQKLIGKQIKVKNFAISKDMLDRFCQLFDFSQGTLIPSSVISSLGNFEEIYTLLNLKPEQILHTRQSAFRYSPLKIGDTIELVTTIKDIYEQQAITNPMGFLTIETTGTKVKKTIFKCVRILAIRGGLPRG